MKVVRLIFVFLFLILLTICSAVYFFGLDSKAAGKNIEIPNNGSGTITVYTGEFGKLVPLKETADTLYGEEGTTINFAYTVSEQSVLSIAEDGTYKAMKPGNVYVTVRGFTNGGRTVFSAYYWFAVYPDMSTVSFEKTSVTEYVFDNYGKATAVKLRSNTVLSEYIENVSVTYSSSNSRMYVSCSLNNNVLNITSYSKGSTVITITINGKVFKINLKIVQVKLSDNSILLTKGKTKKLTIKGISQKAAWKSSNSKIASIDSKGKIKAKKTGNVIITAKLAGGKLGCVVSVTTSTIKKAISKAKQIVKTSTYSQPKRMQKGYYDCSSLVWRSYAAAGKYLGSKSYAPTSADLAKWCAGKKKMVKGGFSEKNIAKLKCKAGDLMFETGAKNGRYKGIYHVEMFIGYALYGFDTNGTPILGTLWANRPESYYWPMGQPLGRP